MLVRNQINHLIAFSWLLPVALTSALSARSSTKQFTFEEVGNNSQTQSFTLTFHRLLLQPSSPGIHVMKHTNARC
jgi:hypothetical protein